MLFLINVREGKWNLKLYVLGEEKIICISLITDNKTDNVEIKTPRRFNIYKGFHCLVVVSGGIEPSTQGFSVLCSTN